MKKIFNLSVVLLFVMAGCQKKDEYLLNRTPDERLTDALAQYQNILTSAQYGWKVIVYPKGLEGVYGIKSAFSYFMQFKDANTVTQLSDFDTTTASVPKTSGYRLKALQRPSIEFDTYGYIHLPCDPDPAISKSPVASEGGGYGWGSDFDFAFADNKAPAQLGDTIRLVGNFNSSPAIMVRATKAEYDAFYAQGLKNAMVLDKILNYFKKITVGSTVFESTPGGYRTITFKYLDGSNNLNTIVSPPYYLTPNSISFVSPFTVNGLVIKSIDNLSFNAATNTATCTINGVTSTIAGAIASIKTDLTAPQRWFAALPTNFNKAWRSDAGFHVNGVDDAYGVKTIPNFYQYWYWYNAISSTVDYFGPMVISGGSLANATYYSRVKSGPTFTVDGRAIFALSANTGTFPASVTNTTNLFYNTTGFYFVQIDNVTYDMVSATDAKSWIRWWHN